MVVVTFAEPHQERGDQLLVDPVDIGDTLLVQELQVAPQVPPVRRQGVRRQPTLDRQVVEVGA